MSNDPAPASKEEKIPSNPIHSPNEGWQYFLHSFIAAEISSITRYMDAVMYLAREERNENPLYELIEAPSKRLVYEEESALKLLRETREHAAIILNGTLNFEHDIEGLLRRLWGDLERTSRVVAVVYNPYLRGLYHLANRLGLREGEQPRTNVTFTDLRNITRLAGFDIVKTRPAGFVPWRLGGLGTFLNRFLAAVPLVRFLSLAWVIVLRPIKPSQSPPSLSIVVPARNEKGNVEEVLKQVPPLTDNIEIIFVEGHSHDGTWEEIQRVTDAYTGKFSIKRFKQPGDGKADAVRFGFSKASGELLTILDADLTMPPELLERFYHAWCMGMADFINGNRLVYPMEGHAMRFLNWLGNIFFAKTLSFVLDARLGDSLCGTKLLARRDYERMMAWRRDFGDFDPFGDFELIFPACSLGLGIIDIPVRYRARTYGSTNIQRFYHGMLLLKMTIIGLLRLKLGAAPRHGISGTTK